MLQKKSQVLTLPPNVSGSKFGSLELSIDKFRWKGNKTFSAIEAEVRFWGQERESSGNIVFRPDEPPPKSLQYEIVTTPRLFSSYLQNSDPIKVKLVSQKTSNFIGASVIRLPDQLLDLHQNERISTTSPIFSTTGFVLGSIVASFLLKLSRCDKIMCEKDLEVEEIAPKQQRTSTKEGPAPEFSEFLINNIPLSCEPSEKTCSKSSIVVDYLTGKPIPPHMEADILKEICTLSPAASFMDIYKETQTILSGHSVVAKKPPRVHSSRDIVKKIDSIRFAVNSFVATKAGIKQIVKKLATSKIEDFNIVIECQICSSDSGSDKNNTMYFISKPTVADSLVNRVEINKQNFRSLRDLSRVWSETTFLTFVLWLRDAKTKMSYIVGASRAPIGQLLQNKLLAEGKIIIKSVNSGVVVGVLSFQVELMCRFMTFGSEQQINQEPVNKKPAEETRERLELTKIRVSGQDGEAQRDSVNRIETAEKDQNTVKKDVFSTLLYFGGFKHACGRQVKLQLSFFDLFLNEFTKADSSSNSINFLRVQPIVIDDEFLSKMKHNYILVEAYDVATSSLVATIKLPLHQFYIAFRDNQIKDHLTKAKLPVISIDGWNNLIKPGDLEIFGQVQVLLAVGTELQVETLKVTRGLGTFSVAIDGMTNARPRNVETQTSPPPANQVPPRLTALSTFIDSLANKLPVTDQSNESLNSCNGNQQMRNTADLLDMLQRALQDPNSKQACSNKKFQSPPTPQPLKPTIVSAPAVAPKPAVHEARKYLPVIIDIERAQNLPIVHLTKKQRQKLKAKGKNVAEVAPSSYVTFEALDGLTEDQVKSHEGLVHTTTVYERDCNPEWNKQFRVYLDSDLLFNAEKNFVFKVWRKSSVLESSKPTPTPLQDAIVGFTAININKLTQGQPICDWFNVVDFNGKCNGRLKAQMRLAETANPEVSVHNIGSGENDDEFSSSLSRALKRKFTELEGISQRLKARLFDVTAEDDIDPDDEFERDLNTEVVEEGATAGDFTADYAWLGASQSMFLPRDSERNVSGCSKPNPDVESLLSDSLSASVDLFKQLLESDIPSTSSDGGNIQTLSKAFKKTSISEDEERPNPEGEDEEGES